MARIIGLLILFVFSPGGAWAAVAVPVTWTGSISGTASPSEWCATNAVAHQSLGYPTTWKCIDNSGVLSAVWTSVPSCPGGRQVDFARMACVPVEDDGIDMLTQLFIGFSLMMAGAGGFQHGRRA